MSSFGQFARYCRAGSATARDGVLGSPSSSSLIGSLAELAWLMKSEKDPTRELSSGFELDSVDAGEMEFDEGAADAMLPRQLELGDYILIRPIGSGGMGHVFKARHRQMDRLVALKLLSDRALVRPDAARRFQREIRAAARLFHPNIVTAFDAGEHGGVQYLVMEYVEGTPLDEMVERHGPLSPEVAAEYIRQAAQGLAFAHSRAVVHRDIKPGNFMLDKATNVVKVLDLGTALFVGSEEVDDEVITDDARCKPDSDSTQSGVIMGTVNYMSPEQAQRKGVDHRADIYSLGCTLHFLLTGRPVFEGDVPHTLIAHATQPPPDLRDARPDVPRWLNDVFQRMAAKNADDRFDSMNDVVAAIREGQEQAQEQPWIRGRRRRQLSQAAMGFDLGSSYGQVAWCSLDEPESIEYESIVSGTSLPAVLAAEGINIYYGDQAWARSPRLEVACNIRRHLGERSFPFALDRASYPSETLVALLMQELDRARGVHEDQRHIVLTVPSSFGEISRRALLDAASIAGWSDVRLHNESTAAILAEGWKLGKFGPKGDEREEQWLVVDLGGGKLDVAAVRLNRERLQIVASAGDRKLGGCDWDQAILDHVSDHCRNRLHLDPRESPATSVRLLRTCERAKVQLSTEFSEPIEFGTNGRRFRFNLTRAILAGLSAPLEQRAEAVLNDCLKRCGWRWSDIDRLLLVGRATRMPWLRNLVLRCASKSVLISEASSDAVARGAALLAAAAGAAERRRAWPGPRLELIASQSRGLAANDAKTGQRRNALLIHRGEALPARARREFLTRQPNQANVSLRVVESPDNAPDQGQVVAHCEVDLPRGLPAGSPVAVEFRLGEDERLVVSVETTKSGYRVTKDLSHRGLLSHVEVARWREWVETVLLCSVQASKG